MICRCLHVFCFVCGENWHDPVKCNLLRKWIKKCDDDSETSNWIAANTKVILQASFKILIHYYISLKKTLFYSYYLNYNTLFSS